MVSLADQGNWIALMRQATAMLDSGVQLAYQCCRVPNGSGEDLFHYFWPAHDRWRNYRLP
jgi:hypothetical protein